jgi:hypothetical protein
MHYGHTNIANDAMDGSVGQDNGQLLPGMEVCVRFKDLEASVYVLHAFPACCKYGSRIDILIQISIIQNHNLGSYQ